MNERELPPFLRLIKARCHLWKMVQSDSINEIDCRFFTIRTVCENTQRPTARRHILPSQSRAKQNLATINYACFLIFQVEHKLNWSFVRFIFIARLFSVPSLWTSFFLPIEIIEFVNFFISHNSSSFSSQMACTKHNKHNKSIFDVFSSTLLFVSLSSPFWQKQKTLHAIKNKLRDKYLSENFVFVSTIWKKTLKEKKNEVGKQQQQASWFFVSIVNR